LSNYFCKKNDKHKPAQISENAIEAKPPFVKKQVVASHILIQKQRKQIALMLTPICQ